MRVRVIVAIKIIMIITVILLLVLSRESGNFRAMYYTQICIHIYIY